MLRLIKQWLKAPVETTDGGGRRRMEGDMNRFPRVRNFLARRHKLPTRGSRHVRMDAVFGTLGVLRPRMCRKAGAMS